MPDPSLTPFGVEQCIGLRQNFPYHDRIGLLVASPLRRTIYTTLLGFTSELKRGLKVTALPEIQETSDLPCDTGSPLEALKGEFEAMPVDLGLVLDGWDSKVGGPALHMSWFSH